MAADTGRRHLLPQGLDPGIFAFFQSASSSCGGLRARFFFAAGITFATLTTISSLFTSDCPQHLLRRSGAEKASQFGSKPSLACDSTA
jgi:hypothetical protein